MSADPGNLLARLRAHAVIEPVDAHLVGWLRDRMLADGGAREEALALTCVAAALCRECSEGSLCLPLELNALTATLRELLLAAEPTLPDREAVFTEARIAAARFLEAADADRFASVLGDPENPRPLVRAFGKLYLHRYWFSARTVADALRTRVALPPPAAEETRTKILGEVLDQEPLRARDGSPLLLTDRQRAALDAALGTPVFVLAGGPGTGKTTWTAAWLRAVLRLPGVAPDRVRLCAPTGRAARRLEESLRATLAGCRDPRDEAAAAMPVNTLHSLLGWRSFEGRFARNPDDPLDADWVLLDEASMADLFLMSALVRALKPGTRIVLSGDPGQLPAVEAGAVLGELLPAGDGAPSPVPSVVLDVSHRATGEVIPLASAVRRGDAEAVIGLLGAASTPDTAFATRPPSREIVRVEPVSQTGSQSASGTASGMRALLKAYAGAVFRTGERNYGELLHRFRTLTREEESTALDALWKHAGRARVLSPLRHGPISAESANRILRELLEPEWRRPGDTPGIGFHGSPVLVTRNDPRTGLSNGDLGMWLQTADGAAAFFPRPELPQGWLRLPAALLPACEPGFAVTVHKSQGSEYDAVLLVLPEAGNRLLARETLYTAVTRARRAVTIFGTEEAIREAVERRLRRPGGLREMLEG